MRARLKQRRAPLKFNIRLVSANVYDANQGSFGYEMHKTRLTIMRYHYALNAIAVKAGSAARLQ